MLTKFLLLLRCSEIYSFSDAGYRDQRQHSTYLRLFKFDTLCCASGENHGAEWTQACSKLAPFKPQPMVCFFLQMFEKKLCLVRLYCVISLTKGFIWDEQSHPALHGVTELRVKGTIRLKSCSVKMGVSVWPNARPATETATDLRSCAASHWVKSQTDSTDFWLLESFKLDQRRSKFQQTSEAVKICSQI